MNAIGSADPLGRPRALTALVVTIVTALVLITGSAWASPSGSERPSVDTVRASPPSICGRLHGRSRADSSTKSSSGRCLPPAIRAGRTANFTRSRSMDQCFVRLCP